jgi:hypothetical protein
MDKSFRIVWELDVDAADARQAAEFAKAAIDSGLAPVFEVHEWDEPDMITATPVAMIDLRDPDADLPVPSTRHFRDQYLGPTII